MQQTFPTIIVENDTLVREGLRLILARTPFVPQSCGTALEELDSLPDIRPALFILVAGGNDELLSDIAKIRERYETSRILVLADISHRALLPGALEAGVNAVLLTSITPEGLIKTLHALMSDEVVVVDARLWNYGLPPMRLDDVIEEAEHKTTVNSIRQLSIREVEILDRIVRGDSNKHIARHFDIAEATVKAHVKAILRKIGVANRTQAAIWAVNNAMPEKNGSEPANDVEFTVAVPERETALPIFRERGPGQTIQIY